MKKSIYIILLSVFLFSACDIERHPYDSVVTEDLLSTEEGLQAATLGNYAILKGPVDSDGWAAVLHRIVEYAGDNVSLSGATTDQLYYFYNYKNIKNNGRSNSFWNLSYKAIVGANKVIELVDEGVSAENDQLIGENYYLRALIYFQIVNVYGRQYAQDPNALGVPLKLTSDITDLPDRNTVGEVYEQVVKDLKKAESLMSIDKGPAFASKPAAQALLSRVYLYMEENQLAIDYANKVIESGKYSLVPTTQFGDYIKMEPKNNPETIFAIKYEKESDYGSGYYTVGSFYAQIEGVGWGEMYASSSYLNLINQHPEDVRKEFIDPQYLLDDNGNKIPAVYWVDEDYNYVFKRTTTQNGNLYFDDNGTQRQVVTESQTGMADKYYFINADGDKTYVTKGYDIDKRNGYPKFYILKCSLQQDVPQLWSPVISRLGELYLNRAEAYAKLGNAAAALEDVNRIRTRAGIPTYTSAADFPTGMDILDIVLQERHLEMAWEGQRKFDIFRNGLTLDRHYPGSHLNGNSPYYEVTPQDNRTILFIPEQQMEAQPSLQQNP